MLKVTYLRALSETDIREIIHWVGETPPDVANAVIQECGGHPFIAQYLMHHLYEANVITSSIETVHSFANKFTYERHADLEQWGATIGKAGLVAYNILAEANTWLSEKDVRSRISNTALNIGDGLVKLCYHGFVIQDGTWSTYHVSGELFRNWFNGNALPILDVQKPFSPTKNNFLDSDPIPQIQFKTLNFPTAYCHSLTADIFPFVTCIIDNTHRSSTNSKVSVQVSFPGFNEPCTDTLIVSSGQSEKTALLPKLNHDVIRSLNEIYPTKCRVVIQKHSDTGSRILFEKDYDIRLHACDTALLAILTTDGLLSEDLADYLSVFVTPHIPEVEHLVRLAAERHPGSAIVGYQGASDLIQARKISQAQAKALFDTLKNDAGLLYTNAPINYGKEPNQITQRVRPPFISLNVNKGQANCIDGSVLFASLLENIGMQSLIAMVPGHAFVGWRVWENVNEFDFLETTMIGTKKFQMALNQGNTLYREALQKDYNKRSLFDPSGFIRIVDIAACRRKGIIPIM